MARTGRAAKLKGAAWALAAVACGGGCVFGIPFLARQLPWSVEQRLAGWQKEVPQLQSSALTENPQAAALFQSAVKRIYPLYPSDRDVPITITVIRGQTVNAFATLGGRIYIYEGLLKQTASAEEFAGVLAHEIEHVKRRHIIQATLVRAVTGQVLQFLFPGSGSAAPQMGSAFLNIRFSRDQEQEADAGGLQRLRDARVGASGLQRFFEREQEKPGFAAILSDHPADRSRARAAARLRGSAPVPVMTPAQWAVVKKACR